MVILNICTTRNLHSYSIQKNAVFAAVPSWFLKFCIKSYHHAIHMNSVNNQCSEIWKYLKNQMCFIQVKKILKKNWNWTYYINMLLWWIAYIFYNFKLNIPLSFYSTCCEYDYRNIILKNRELNVLIIALKFLNFM